MHSLDKAFSHGSHSVRKEPFGLLEITCGKVHQALVPFDLSSAHALCTCACMASLICDTVHNKMECNSASKYLCQGHQPVTVSVPSQSRSVSFFPSFPTRVPGIQLFAGFLFFIHVLFFQLTCRSFSLSLPPFSTSFPWGKKSG